MIPEVKWGKAPRLLVAIVSLSAGLAHAASGVWNGASDGYWTNSLNWSASPYPSSGETATFNNAGNGRTGIDVAGLPIIKNITFTSADAAAYTVGAGGARAQTLVMEDAGVIKLDASAANSQVINANLQLGTNRANMTLQLQNDSTAHTLTVAGDLLFPQNGLWISGIKYVNLYGAGETRLLGSWLRFDTGILTCFGCGKLALPGSNHVSRVSFYGSSSNRIDIGTGHLFIENTGYVVFAAEQNGVIDGTGILRISANASDNLSWWTVKSGSTVTVNPTLRCASGLKLYEGNGTLVLNGINEIASNIVVNCEGAISAAKIGNRGSADSNLGQGERFVFNGNGGKLLYTGTGETSDRILEVNNNATLDHSGTGELIFSDDLIVGGTVKTLTLQGSTEGTGEVAGVIGAGAAATSLNKSGSGTWRLSGANTYAGATTVAGGTLVLAGADGAAAASSGFTVQQGCVLQISNAAAANNSDRLGNTAPVTLNGGTLSFAHTGGAASYSETVGGLTIGAGANTVAASQADASQTSRLTFASLSRTSGTVDFAGTGLGESGRSRIFITGQADGLIGSWATVNGSLAAYSATLGVHIAGGDDFAGDIAARGPNSVIPDNAALSVRINSSGTNGPITLAGTLTDSILLLQQNTATASTVAMRDGTTNKTLLAGGVLIAPDKAALTIGESAGDGLIMALNPGGELVLANHSTSASLTVNAVVTNHTSASSLTKSGAGDVTLAVPARYTGATKIEAGALTFGGASDQTLSNVVSGMGSLVKAGTGTLRLAGDNSAYLGETRIDEGTVIVDHSNALGPNGAGTVIASNATLDVGGSLAANALNKHEPITVCGTGAGGKGAVVNSSVTQQSHALGKVSLAGDTTFGATGGRFDLWPDTLTPFLDLNGHTLSKIGANLFCLVNVDVNPGAGHIDLKEGRFWVAYATRLNGGATNTLTVRAGASLQFCRLVDPQSWTLALENDSSFRAIDGTVPLNTWDGPVTLTGGTVLFGGSSTYTYSMRVNGPVSGTGSLVKVDGALVYLANTNNTYTGTTVVSNGVLHVAHAGSLPGYGTPGKVTVAPAGTLVAMTGDGTAGWGKGQLDTLCNTTTFATPAATLGLDTSAGDFVYDSDISQTNYIFAKLGTNTLTLAGDTLLGPVQVRAGTLALGDTGTNAFASLLVTGGQESALDIGRPLTLMNYGSVTIGNASGDRCVTRVTSDLTLTTPASRSTYGRLYVGNGSGSAGAVYQTAGRVSASSGSMYADYVSLGNNSGYGYYRMTGGELVTGEMGVTGGQGGGNCVGVFDLYGGTVNVDTAYLILGWVGGIGVMNLHGGSVVSDEYVNMNLVPNKGMFSMLNLLAPTVSLRVTQLWCGIEMAKDPGTNEAAVVNLNGGTLTAAYVKASKSAITNTPNFLNFNGGTLRGTNTRDDFIQGLTAATIYPGGAVIDTAGFNLTAYQSLQSPAGYGVTGIALASGGAGYIGAPAVKISGGSGTNATAIAEVDVEEGSPTRGRVTGLTVTSPGFGYQASDTLTVTFYGGGFTNAATAGGVALGANSSSGGLTKIGAGILTLGGTNTYAGATVISNGTVKLGNALALKTGTPVILAGGTLDLGGFTVTNALGGTGGTVNNGTLQVTVSPAGAGSIGADTFTPGTATVKGAYLADVAADGASDHLTVQGSLNLSTFTLELVNPSLLASSKVYTLATVTGTRTGTFTVTNLPDSKWHMAYRPNGKVELRYSNGTIIGLR